MDVVLAVKKYVSKMIADSGTGMRVLMMDKETTGIVSMVYTRSEILQKEVYLFENIGNEHGEVMKHLNAIVFVRPTKENVQLLCKELKNPRYGKYYLYFSHALSKSDVKVLAESDEHECVSDINEYFADFYPVDIHHFTLNITNCARHFIWSQNHLTRTCHGLTSVFLALKKCPMIRYQANSEMCHQLADSVKLLISREASLFDFRRSDSTPMLLILDRRFDPVTPLLNQWTYQAMTHELLGIKNGRVDLSQRPGVKKDLHEVVLSPLHDQFYRENLYKNFGEIGSSIKELMDDFQAKTRSQQKVESIDDMKAFVENYPQFKKMSGTVAKHVTVVGELSKIVGANNLLEISECEQDIACQSDHSSAIQKVRALLRQPSTSSVDALRLVALYSLRYDSHSNNATTSLTDQLASRDSRRIISGLLKYASIGGRLSQAAEIPGISMTRKFFKGLKGVENVYTQHVPKIKDTIEELLKGRLRESDYPYAGSSIMSERPSDVIVFIVGGTTYEEVACVDSINSSNSGVRIILGGTTIHNGLSFIDEFMTATAS
uniref:Vacuolar protein sorting-associated protein 45 n=1 Tax=Phallusia mammillata TaxID=59560 RepID=A0A6F9DX93_9ASCI|nr:vacuolar protein sorting-associated protein 45-like [Phallusia mammillata]